MLHKYWFGRFRACVGAGVGAILGSAWVHAKLNASPTLCNAYANDCNAYADANTAFPLSTVLLRRVSLASGVSLNKSNECWNKRNEQNRNNNKLEVVLNYWNAAKEVTEQSKQR